MKGPDVKRKSGAAPGLFKNTGFDAGHREKEKRVLRIDEAAKPLPGLFDFGAEHAAAAPGENNLLKLSLLMIGIVAVFPLMKVGFVTNDDLQLSLKARQTGVLGYMGHIYWVLKLGGRANFANLLWHYLPYVFKNFIYYKIVALGSIVSTVILLAYFMGRLFGSEDIFYFSLLAGFVGLQNSWECTPLVSFPGIFSFPLICLLLSFIFFLEFTRGRKGLLIPAAGCYLLALFSYEVYILYCPVFFLISWFGAGQKPALARLKPALPFIFAGLFYLSVYALFRHHFGSHYAGVQAQSRLNIASAMKTLWQFSVSSLPSYFIWDRKYRWLFEVLYNENAYSGLRGFTFLRLESAWAVKSLLVAVVCFLILRRTGPFHAGKLRFSILLGVIYFFLPTALFAITEHYQDTVKHGTIGIQGSYFSFLAFIYCFVPAVVLIKQKMKRKALKYAFVMSTALLMAGLSILIDNSNGYIAKYQKMSDMKWQAVDRFLQSEEFRSVPDGSVIYAPSLWTIIGSVGIHDSYWSEYFSTFSGKSIKVVNHLDRNPGTDLFYLKYNQLLKDEEQYLVFARLEDAGPEDGGGHLFASQATVYNLSKYVRYYILGRLRRPGETVIEAYGLPGLKANGLFQIKVSENFYRQHDLKSTSIIAGSGNQIDLDSLFVLPGSSEEIRFAANGGG